jgi:hypothetical protein
MEEQDLQAFVRKPFTVYLAGAKVELELIDVRALPPRQVPGLRRNPFKLLFRGPPVRHYTEALPRQVHELHAADGGYFRSTWNRSLAPASLGCCTKQFLTSPHFSHPVKKCARNSDGLSITPKKSDSGAHAAKDRIVWSILNGDTVPRRRSCRIQGADKVARHDQIWQRGGGQDDYSSGTRSAVDRSEQFRFLAGGISANRISSRVCSRIILPMQSLFRSTIRSSAAGPIVL